MTARTLTLFLLTPLLLALLASSAAAQADCTPLTIHLGKKAVFSINAPPGCKLSVSVTTEGEHAFDPEIIKPQAKKGAKPGHVLTCKGLALGTSIFRYDYTTKGPCKSGGGFLYEITVVADPDDAAAQWRKRLKQILKELKGDLKGHVVSTAKELSAATKQVKKNQVEDADELIGTLFDRVQCDREAALQAAIDALTAGRDEGTDALGGLGIPDTGKGHHFSRGGCGDWDTFVHGVNDALGAADGKIIGADRKFTKAFNGGGLGRLTSILHPLPHVDQEPPRGGGTTPLDEQLLAAALFQEHMAALSALAHPLPTADPGVAPGMTVRVCLFRPQLVAPDPGIPPFEVDLNLLNDDTVPVPLGPQSGRKLIGSAQTEALSFLALTQEALNEIAVQTTFCDPLDASANDLLIDDIDLD
jgi:hypothetical protein